MRLFWLFVPHLHRWVHTVIYVYKNTIFINVILCFNILGQPQQRQILSTFCHVDRGLIHSLTHSHSCARCNVVSYFAKVFLRVLCGRCIWAGIGPGPTALIMSLLKMGVLPGLSLSKHHLSYSCKVIRETQWAAASCSSAVNWLIKALWKMWEHGPLQMEALEICWCVVTYFHCSG